MITVMTIIDQIYSVKAWFKSKKTTVEGRERQFDKLMLKFYLKVMGEAKRVPEGQMYNTERLGEAKRLYVRVSNMFK